MCVRGLKRWLFVPGASPIDPVANGGIEIKNVATPTIGGPKPMVGVAASCGHDAMKQIPATQAHKLPVYFWRTQRACGGHWASGGGAHHDGSTASATILSRVHRADFRQLAELRSSPR